MWWHDARIHSVCFDSDNVKLMFDIDYIFAWVDSAPGTTGWSFWVSPCTLVFDNAYDLTMDVESSRLYIMDLQRGEYSVPENGAFIGKSDQWTWNIECDTADISLKSTGYTQYTRRKPRHISGQGFSLTERGGVSFGQPANPAEWDRP